MAGSGTAGSPGSGGSAGSGTAGGPGGGTGGGSAGTGGFGGSPDPGVCGNGIPEWYEQCDLGDTTDGDGCSSACEIEPGFACDLTSCHPVVCGDGIADWYPVGDGSYDYEDCDDGNAAGDDGCSATCEIELGFVCHTPGLPCREVRCGDGFQDGYVIPGEPGTGGTGGMGGTGDAGTAGTSMGGTAGAAGGSNFFYEGCDDGNEVGGDGCSAACEVESGYLCEMPGTPCRQPRCGDGFQDFIWTSDGTGGGSSMGGSGGTAGAAGGTGHYENCDDGNLASGDGCTSDCNVESGYLCTVPGTPCRIPACGDGFVDFIPDPNGCDTGAGGSGGTAGTGMGGSAGAPACGTFEQCDDGNTSASDGCSDTCVPEEGYVCYEPGAPCTVAVCGNGLVEWPVEECDDGNEVSGDGCTADCRGEW